MFDKFLRVVFLSGLTLFAGSALAVPVLQLDIDGGFYVAAGEDSIMTSDEIFSVYAYATPKNNKPSTEAEILADTYYLSIALSPQVDEPGGDFGSFVVNGTTVNATQDMTFGTPPTTADRDIGSHGVYDTYYYEIEFSLNPANTSGVYNTQDAAGSGPIAGQGMFFEEFEIDLSNLASGMNLHFDLYNLYAKNNGMIFVDDFAPFSHDAASARVVTVPAPGTLGLILLGFVGILIGQSRTRRVNL